MSKMQLFCFSYAGGTASFFDTIEKDLTDIDVVKIEYSGHGVRHREPMYKSFSELTDDVYKLMKEHYAGGPYAMFGYSMGTITLVEVLSFLLSDPDMKVPNRVFLAAHEPHSKAELSGYTAEELDDWVKKRTIAFGGVPEKLINSKPFWRTYLPIYRADYGLIAKYRFEDLRLSTQIPATIFYTETDTPRMEMELWRKYFQGECEFFCYEGMHFFINKHHEEMAATMLKRLKCED